MPVEPPVPLLESPILRVSALNMMKKLHFSTPTLSTWNQFTPPASSSSMALTVYSAKKTDIISSGASMACWPTQREAQNWEEDAQLLPSNS